MVGPFNSDYYLINGMVLESRKRREHLSEEDLQKNRAIIETLTRGGHSQVVNGDGETVTFLFVGRFQNSTVFKIFGSKRREKR